MEIVTILEDHVEKLEMEKVGKGDVEFDLAFRGFEIKTVRVTVAKGKKGDGWVKL